MESGLAPFMVPWGDLLLSWFYFSIFAPISPSYLLLLLLLLLTCGHISVASWLNDER